VAIHTTGQATLRRAVEPLESGSSRQGVKLLVKGRQRPSGAALHCR